MPGFDDIRLIDLRLGLLLVGIADIDGIIIFISFL